MTTRIRYLGRNLFDLLFHDQFRLVELFSGLNLLAWAKVMLTDPAILARNPTYAAFLALSPQVWAAIFVAVATLQLTGAASRHRWTGEHRFVAMGCAAGAWSAITAAFVQGGVSTTATLNYGLLALICIVSGVALGWKSSSLQR
ncbi:MAG: hypothetical protein ACU0BF_01790 [Paracoccaceae bacterium]